MLNSTITFRSVAVAPIHSRGNQTGDVTLGRYVDLRRYVESAAAGEVSIWLAIVMPAKQVMGTSDGRARGRAAARAVLSRRIHAAGAGRRHRLPQDIAGSRHRPRRSSPWRPTPNTFGVRIGVPPSCIRGVRRSLSSLGDFRTPAPVVCAPSRWAGIRKPLHCCRFHHLREMSCDWLVTVLPLGARWAPKCTDIALPRSSTRQRKRSSSAGPVLGRRDCLLGCAQRESPAASLPAAHELRAGPGAGGGEKIDENHEPRLSASG